MLLVFRNIVQIGAQQAACSLKFLSALFWFVQRRWWLPIEFNAGTKRFFGAHDMNIQTGRYFFHTEWMRWYSNELLQELLEHTARKADLNKWIQNIKVTYLPYLSGII
jgi:uncharacterized membrane protein YheB (UPF0754 family)